ncbi:phosphotransferase [Dactylosporangium aurantiacum]|uniref:Phosphotransferase n=1 Tax=Dactylosporangium aurantiacum TaxID=35754 RepID=A0A9Q9IA38_9ACTN|nr:phosphotransferase [Dactylosporangium aurantiacum]MDG6103509.1 phosphotransferase [Dactylosporangium aurantiacum]UWZ51991.1 phosphotransferase [Dactylosporangium aurantiacum]
MRWVRALAAPDDIGELVAARCGLVVTGCALVRSLTNDVYRVETAGGAYACKVYGTGRYSAGQVAWEQELAAHLAAAGVTGAVPVPVDGGALVGSLDAPEGVRLFTVTVWAGGDKPRPPWTDGLFRRYGAALARLHTAADGFTSARPGRADDPLATLEACLPSVEDPVVHEVAAVARERLAGAELDIGVRHGDASLDNLHLTAGGGLLWHDFDLAAVGWRAADLTGAYGGAHWPAFVEGYRTLRPIDTGAVAALRVVELVRNVAWHLTDKVALRGTESVGEGWVERELASLHRMRDQL